MAKSPKQPKGGEQSSSDGAALVSVSFRTTAEVEQRMRQAAAMRSIKREHPYTKQDIFTEALADWLDAHGY